MILTSKFVLHWCPYLKEYYHIPESLWIYNHFFVIEDETYNGPTSTTQNTHLLLTAEAKKTNDNARVQTKLLPKSYKGGNDAIVPIKEEHEV